MSSSPAAVVVLAAGEGTRMKSALPKVLHPLLGRPMVGHVLAAVQPLGSPRTLVVVGHGRTAVTEALTTLAPGAEPVVQADQLGTGHALQVVLEQVPDLRGTLLVVSGDTPLLRTQTLDTLLSHHTATAAAATVLTAQVADPTGYGRVVRADDGSVAAIVEHRDATAEVLAVDEINGGIYAFDTEALRGALARLTTDNSQGEHYLTDVVALLRSDGRPVSASVVADAEEVHGVNDRVQLAVVGRALRDRVLTRWMRDGVSVVDPASTWVDIDVELAPDVELLPGTALHGATTVAKGAVVGPHASLTDTVVAAGARVIASTCIEAEIGEGASVGPYAYLRPGTRLEAGAKAGAYVELKNAHLGVGAKVPHLSYVGDAEIGEGSNIGAATVVVNYDGVEKHRTVVGREVRIGSDTMLVAPVTIGDGAYTAAGSVITEDVPPGAMGVGRARQRTITGWVARKRAGSKAAAAAEQAMADRQGEQAESGDQGQQKGGRDG